MTSWKQVLPVALYLNNAILKASFIQLPKTEQLHPEGKFYMARQNWAMISSRQVLQGTPKLSNDILKASNRQTIVWELALLFWQMTDCLRAA